LETTILKKDRRRLQPEAPDPDAVAAESMSHSFHFPYASSNTAGE
jgi:hypothetical protein